MTLDAVILYPWAIGMVWLMVTFAMEAITK